MKASLLNCISFAVAGSVSLDFQRKAVNIDELDGHNAKFLNLAKSKAGHAFRQQVLADFYSYYTVISGGLDEAFIVKLDTGIRDSWIYSNDTFSSGIGTLPYPWKIHHSGYDVD